MPKPLSRSRKSKLEPYTIDELLNNPSMRGLVSFLDVHPERRTAEPNPAVFETATVVPFPGPENRLQLEDHRDQTETNKEPLLIDARTSGDVLASDVTPTDTTSLDVLSPDLNVPVETSRDVLPDGATIPTPAPVARLASRRRVIYVGDRAQNAHTPSENVFYAWVWRHGRPQDEDTRVLALKVPIVAYELNMAERNTRFLIERMIHKLAIEPLPGWIQGQQTGKTYAIYSFRRILERRRSAGLLYALKGKGVELITEQQARQYTASQTPPVLEDYGDEQPTTSPDVASRDALYESFKTSRDATGKTSSDVLAAPSLYQSKSTTSEETKPTQHLARLLSPWITIDDDAVRQIFQSCRRGTPDCTPEEIASFARAKLPLINSGKIDNPPGLLIRTIPKFFENGGSIALKELRDSTRKRREEDYRRTQELREQQQRILEDPNATEEDKEWARQMLSSGE